MLLPLVLCLLIPACLVCARDPPPQKKLRDKLTEILPKVYVAQILVTCEDYNFNVIQTTNRAARDPQSLDNIVEALCGKKSLNVSPEEKADYKCCKTYIEERLQEFACACGRITCRYLFGQPSKCANAIFPDLSTRQLPDECTQ